MTFECCLWALLPVGVALLLWGDAWYDRYESLSEGAMKRYLLQLLHNAVAHPVLGLLGYPAPAWAVRFHDWTAELAWPGHLKYVNETPAITQVKRVATPGRRLYFGYQEIPRVLNGLGISILSTSRGLMNNQNCLRHKVGGELVCTVW